MGDFEDVFGTGADADGIIDGFSRAESRHCRETEAHDEAEWKHFAESVFLAAKIEAGDYSIFLKDYAEVEDFDRLARCFHTGEYEFSFLRQAEASGYRVQVARDGYKPHFTRPGRIVVVSSPEEAVTFSKRFGAEVFDADERPGNAASPIWPLQVKSRWDEPHGRFLELLDVGQQVVLWGWRLEIVLRSRARFIGWDGKEGFEPIVSASSLTAYRWRKNHTRRNSSNIEPATSVVEPELTDSPYSIVGLDEYLALIREGKKANWEK